MSATDETDRKARAAERRRRRAAKPGASKAAERAAGPDGEVDRDRWGRNPATNPWRPAANAAAGEAFARFMRGIAAREARQEAGRAKAKAKAASDGSEIVRRDAAR